MPRGADSADAGPPQAAAVRRFESLSYDDFRRLAADEQLSEHERVGFPTWYREGKEDAIFEDIVRKLPALRERGRLAIEIGPGCSGLPRRLIELTRRNDHTLVLVDSEEMLSQLPDGAKLTKLAGRFPEENRLDEFTGRADAVLVYSVLHYVFVDGNVWAFLDRALALLAPGGALLVGDVPNVSKRRRFFSSEAGRAFHREYTQSTSDPDVTYGVAEPGKIDDAVVFGLISRARAAGFDAYVLPQADELPMANRREDLLFTRP